MSAEKKKEKTNFYEDADETGYSERQSDINAEIKAGEWQNLRNFSLYHTRTRQWRIIATYQAISNRLNQLVTLYYKLVRDHPKQAEKMLLELNKLRYLQEILLQCMVWEPKGELEKDMIPQEVWDIIK